ncbi:MAG: hypothetical protein FJ020_08095 [Chloroflexi bacterium]|nr:hypothetical protein [Chloroflexota bacterium]
MLALLLRIERRRRSLRRRLLDGRCYHMLGILVALGSLAFLPAAPAGLSAGLGFIFLGFACVLTIILAPLGGCLL